MRAGLDVVALACIAGLALPYACHRGHAVETDVLPPEAIARSHIERLGDVSLRVVQVGPDRGAPMLVLHDGPGLDHTYMRPWLDGFAPDSQLDYVDIRGHGRSSAPADANGYTLSAATADFATLAQRLCRGEPCNVLGHGFGAAIAMELAARHPEAVRRLILVDPLRDGAQLADARDRGREALGESGWQRVESLTTAQGTLRDATHVSEWFRRLGRLWWHTNPSDAVIDRLGRDMLYRGETDAAFRVDLAGWDGRAIAPDVRAPTLVISGADDAIARAGESRALAETLPHGTYVEIANAGHCPFVEQASRFDTIVRGFLRVDAHAE